MFIQADAASYLEQFRWERDHHLQRLEEEAKRRKIPIVLPDTIQLISQLIRMKNAKSILEIGTAIGYSTIWLARSAPGGHVLSIDKEEAMLIEAKENLEKAGLVDRVTLLHHDASLGMPEDYKDHRFDFLFIDAGKDEYDSYLTHFMPYLEEGAVIVTDNIFFHGLAFPTPKEDARNAWIGEKIDRFNHALFKHPLLLTHFLPIGDGIAISIKLS